MDYDWNWSVFLEQALDGQHTYWQTLLLGAGWTLMLAAGAWTLAMVWGSFMGTLRCINNRWLNGLAVLYIEIFRNIPLLVQLFLWYFVVPDLLPHGLGQEIKQLPYPWGAYWMAVCAMGFYGAARLAETLRGGIESLPQGQLQAARALGMGDWQAFRLIILPEAYRIILPPLTSELMGTIKYSSVALTIGLLELTGQARSMAEFTFHIFEAFCAASVCYLLINGAISLGMRWLEHVVAVPGLTGMRAPAES